MLLKVFLVKSRAEDSGLVRSEVKKAGQHVTQCQVPSEPIVLAEINESFLHHLRENPANQLYVVRDRHKK